MPLATLTRVYERGVGRRRTGSYDNFSLSASGRYRIQEDLMIIAGFSQSIQRAALSSLAAVASVDDSTMTGTIPNPNLKPEQGNNYSIRVEKYFEPAGVLSAGVFRFDMTDYHAQLSGVPAEEIGIGAARHMTDRTSSRVSGLRVEIINQGGEILYAHDSKPAK